MRGGARRGDTAASVCRTCFRLPTRPWKSPPHATARKPLCVQLITAIVVGVLLLHLHPGTGEAMEPIGDRVIGLIGVLACTRASGQRT